MLLAAVLAGCPPPPAASGDGGADGGADAGATATGGGAPDAGPATDGGTPDAGPAPAPSSYTLLEDAVDAGLLGEEQSLVYKLGIDFGWPPVPAEFHGDDRGRREGDAVGQLLAYVERVGEASVAPATLDALHRCQAPAYQEGSWWNQLHPTAEVAKPSNLHCDPRWTPCGKLADWTAVESPHVVVWYLAADAPAALAAATLVSTEVEATIWPRLTGLMPAPLGDLQVPGESDPRLDIILVRLAGDYGRTVPLHPGSTPVKVYIDPTSSEAFLKVTAAHELMHASQYSYPIQRLRSPITATEATATWAEHYVYPAVAPAVAEQHRLAARYLAGPYTDAWVKLTANADRDAAYGAYLLFLLLEKDLGARVVPRLFESLAAIDDEWSALDTAVTLAGGDLQREWKRFAAFAWNQYTIDFFRQLDGNTETAKLPDENDLGVRLEGGVKLLPLDPRVKQGAVAYYRVNFIGTDQRSVSFLNGWTFKRGLAAEVDGPSFQLTGLGLLDRHGLAVQLFLKVGDAWQSEAIDVTNLPWFSVCRDDPAGNIDELVVIFSNAATLQGSPNRTLGKAQGEPTAFFTSNVACKSWTGALSMSRPRQGGGHESLTVTGATLLPMLSLAAPLPGTAPPAYPLAEGEKLPIGYGFPYALQSGSAHWSFDETIGACRTQGDVTTSLVPVYGDFVAPNWAPIGPLERGIIFGAFASNTQPQFRATRTCTDSQGHTTTTTVAQGASVDLGGVQRSQAWVQPDGLQVLGTAAQTPDTQDTGTWSLQGGP